MQPLPGSPHCPPSRGDGPDIEEQPEAAATPLGTDPGLHLLHGPHDTRGHGPSRSHCRGGKGGEGGKGALLPLLVDVRHELCNLCSLHRGLQKHLQILSDQRLQARETICDKLEKQYWAKECGKYFESLTMSDVSVQTLQSGWKCDKCHDQGLKIPARGVAEGDDLGGTNKGEVQRIEEEDDVLTTVVLQADLLKLTWKYGQCNLNNFVVIQALRHVLGINPA